MTRTGTPAQKPSHEQKMGQHATDQLPKSVATLTNVVDMSSVHDESLPWTVIDGGVLHATGFNAGHGNKRTNHACVDITYELSEPGAIAYRWKVDGCDGDGHEIFDRYWFLKGSDGTFLMGSDFLGQREEFSMHLIDGLGPGSYNLTLGVFCFGTGGSVMLDLAPSA